ncbi:MAG: type II toxin-antitoxin system ParD family antitoxin [Spirochaetaceae bacterium]
MNVSLTPEFDMWISEKVKSGLYSSSSEVIREGLRLLKQKEEQRNAVLQDLRVELDIGLNQLKEGKSRQFDKNLLKYIKTNARKR